MDAFRACARGLVVGALLTTAGCDLTDSDPPATAHYRVEASQDIQLITSTSFFLAGGTSVTLVQADTVVIRSKEATVDLPSPPRFYVRAISLSAGTNVSLLVDVGDRRWYDASRTLGADEPLEFVYGYTGSSF